MDTQQHVTSKFKNITKCLNELEHLAKTKSPNKRVNLIKNAESCLIDAISELASNCLAGNVPLNKCQFKKLSKYKAILRRLRRKTKVNTRKKILSQNGGILPALVGPALTLLTSLIGSELSKKL